MPDCPDIVSSYESLMESIDTFRDVQELNVNDTVALASFADAIINSEALMIEFEQAIPQFAISLDNYDFLSGFRFEVFDQIIESLRVLLTKLEIMEEEVKKLAACPDRRGSKKTVETCNKLIAHVKEKVGLDEVEKVTAWAETNTQKLISIRQQIDKDEREELTGILTSLSEGNPMMWDDVADKYKKRIEKLLKGDLRSMSFDLELFKKEIENEKDNRRNDIQNIQNKYPWLQRKRHKDFHASLIARHLTFGQYREAIAEKAEKRVWIILGMCVWIFVLLGVFVSIGFGVLF